MKTFFISGFIAIVLLNTTIVHANYVSEYPIQVQLQVYPLGSFNLGLHFNEHWYFGGMFLASETSAIQNKELYQQEGVKKSGSLVKQESQQVFEIRYSPWSWGMYLSVGQIDTNPYKKTIIFDQRQRKIGSNTYETGLIVESIREAKRSLGHGFGFNYIASNHFSFGIGFFFALEKPKVEVEIRQQSAVDTISQTDVQTLKSIVEEDEAFASRIFHISFGINF